MARRHAQVDEAEINITPMLDIVFIMLIFFIVTTSFTKETGAGVSASAICHYVKYSDGNDHCI